MGLFSFNISVLDVLPGRLGRVLKLVLEARPHSVRPVNRFRHFRNNSIFLFHNFIISCQNVRRCGIFIRTEIIQYCWPILLFIFPEAFFGEILLYHYIYLSLHFPKPIIMIIKKEVTTLHRKGETRSHF